MTDDTSQRIVEAAMEEFSQEGFGGARVARIADKAGVNKALLFYYYRSKEKLYGAVLEAVMSRILGPLIEFMEQVQTAEEFIEGFPRLHMSFAARNQKLIRIGIGHFIGRPAGLSPEVAKIFKNRIGRIKEPFFQKIQGWIQSGQIRAEDPYQFIINVLSLNLFCFLARPLLETISDIPFDSVPDFLEKRTDSVVQLLKGGMLP